MEMLIELYENRIKLFINNAFIAFSRQNVAQWKKRINNSCCGIVYHSHRLRYLIKQLKTPMFY